MRGAGRAIPDSHPPFRPVNFGFLSVSAQPVCMIRAGFVYFPPFPRLGKFCEQAPEKFDRPRLCQGRGEDAGGRTNKHNLQENVKQWRRKMCIFSAAKRPTGMRR